MKIIGKTDIGCNRAENQDTFRSGSIPAGGAWGLVCDGMGGAQNGRLASAVAADCIEEMLFRQLSEAGETQSAQNMLDDALQLANAEVFTRSGAGGAMMGTTAVCAIVRAGRLHVAHVGDSRAYLFAGGRLTQLTRDHSMVQEMVDTGAISPAEAARHPEKNVITRALGVEEFVEPAFSEHAIAKDDIVLLCSDGLTNMVNGDGMLEIFKSEDYYDLPRALVNRALEEGGDDNITVLVMRPEAEDLP